MFGAVLAVGLLGMGPHAAYAQATIPPNPDVRVLYGRVKDRTSKAERVRHRLEDGRILERFAEFMWPLRLRHELLISAEECGQERNRYEFGSNKATICYELVDKLEQAAARSAPKRENVQRMIVVGAFVQALLHEVALAVFDQMQIPIWGRMEDAADRLAALIMVMFDEDAARITITGTADALAFASDGEGWTGTGFASLNSPELQRRYNFFCIAWAADPRTFAFLVDEKRPFIPENRRRMCRDEFEEIRRAFNLRVMPHVDPDRLVLIRTRRWLP